MLDGIAACLRVIRTAPARTVPMITVIPAVERFVAHLMSGTPKTGWPPDQMAIVGRHGGLLTKSPGTQAQGLVSTANPRGTGSDVRARIADKYRHLVRISPILLSFLLDS